LLEKNMEGSKGDAWLEDDSVIDRGIARGTSRRCREKIIMNRSWEAGKLGSRECGKLGSREVGKVGRWEVGRKGKSRKFTDGDMWLNREYTCTSSGILGR
jgi:hypothetical protein